MSMVRLVLPLYIDIIKILYMSVPLYACSMASLPVLVYWCGGVTTPHTGLAYVLQRFGSFPVNPCGCRYFWKRRCVYADFFQNDSVLGEAAYSCGRTLCLILKVVEQPYLMDCENISFEWTKSLKLHLVRWRREQTWPENLNQQKLDVSPPLPLRCTHALPPSPSSRPISPQKSKQI